MNKQFFDFLFDLRASGLIHHTPEKQRELILSSTHDNSVASNISLLFRKMDGEIGCLSSSKLRDLRNMFIGINFIVFTSTSSFNIDAEYSCCLCDYYCNKAEEIESFSDFEKLYKDMMDNLTDLITAKKRAPYNRIINKCIHYIDQNLYSSLRVEEICKHAGYSQQHISSHFRKNLGMTISQYINHRKVEEAKTILSNTNKRLSLIALSLGFSSLPHFSASFKKITGITPMEYRLQNS